MRRYEIYNARKRLFTRVVDTLLTPFGRAKSTGKPEKVKRLLLCRTSYLGDIVMALPALRAFRKGFADSRITILTSRAGRDLLAHEGVADEILCYEPPWFYETAAPFYGPWRSLCRTLRSTGFDLAVDLRGDLREIALLLRPCKAARLLSYDFAGGGPLLTDVAPFPARKHKIDLMLDLARHAGVADVTPTLGLAVRQEGRAEARRLLLRAGIEGAYALVHPGTRVALKRYAGLEAAASLLAKRLPDGIALAWLGADGSAGDFSRVDASALSVDGLIEIVREASLLLCHDSAPWHIAQAVGTKACAIFGPSKPWATGLYPGRPGVALCLPLPCRDRCDETVCRYGKVDKECLVELSPELVAESARSLLSR